MRSLTDQSKAVVACYDKCLCRRYIYMYLVIYCTITRQAFVFGCISHCTTIQLISLQFNAYNTPAQCSLCVRQQTMSIFALRSNMATIVVSMIVICLRHVCTRDHGRKGHYLKKKKKSNFVPPVLNASVSDPKNTPPTNKPKKERKKKHQKKKN